MRTGRASAWWQTMLLQARRGARILRSCPPGLLPCLFALLWIYVPEIGATAAWWFHGEKYAHGMFVFPIAVWLIWMQREAIRAAVPRPTGWGLPLLAFGLLLQLGARLLDFKFLGIVSLIPAIAGCVLCRHGLNLWRIVQFPVCFLLFAAKIPVQWLTAPAAWVQHCSVMSAATIMKTLGYPVFQTGNILELPGIALEVVEACSGFRKLTALILFATLYGYLYPISLRKRIFLLLMVAPIAVLANIARVCGLVAVAWAGSPRALAMAHDGAEAAVLVLAFALTVLIGKRLGCTMPKFLLSTTCSDSSERDEIDLFNARRRNTQQRDARWCDGRLRDALRCFAVGRSAVRPPARTSFFILPSSSATADEQPQAPQRRTLVRRAAVHRIDVRRANGHHFNTFGMTACCLGALSVNLLYTRGLWRQQTPLPIHRFPRQLGDWTGEAERPLEAFIQSGIPTADVVDRIYANTAGRRVNLLLVTAADTVDIHDPQQCLPGQGWEIQRAAPLTFDGQTATDLHTRNGAQTLETLFWWTQADADKTGLRPAWQILLHRVGGRGALLIRLSAPDTPADHAALLSFAHQCLAPLKAVGSRQ